MKEARAGFRLPSSSIFPATPQSEGNDVSAELSAIGREGRGKDSRAPLCSGKICAEQY
jgi:hypothetical protein